MPSTQDMLIVETSVLTAILTNYKGASGLVIINAPFPLTESLEVFTMLVADTVA